MLHGQLQLHDLDCEQFCRRIINRKHWDLEPHQHDDLLAYLIAECWEASLKWPHLKPTSRKGRFSDYAYTVLHTRAIDWLRRERGRTVFRYGPRRHPIPELVPLTTLDGTEHRLTVDGTPDSSPDLHRLLRERTSPTPPDHSGKGQSPYGRAA